MARNFIPCGEIRDAPGAPARPPDGDNALRPCFLPRYAMIRRATLQRLCPQGKQRRSTAGGAGSQCLRLRVHAPKPHEQGAGGAGGQRLRLRVDAPKPHEQGAWALCFVPDGAMVQIDGERPTRRGRSPAAVLGDGGDGETDAAFPRSHPQNRRRRQAPARGLAAVNSRHLPIRNETQNTHPLLVGWVFVYTAPTALAGDTVALPA